MKYELNFDSKLIGSDEWKVKRWKLYGGSGRALFEYGAEAQIQHGRIALLDGRLVDHIQAETLGLAVGPVHFEEGVDVAHRRNQVRYERLPFRFDFQNLRPESVHQIEIRSKSTRLDRPVLTAIHQLWYRMIKLIQCYKRRYNTISIIWFTVCLIFKFLNSF